MGMKKEILLSLREEAVLLKEQLADAVKWANGEFVKLEEGLATEVKTSNEGNAALKGDIDANKAPQCVPSGMLLLPRRVHCSLSKSSLSVRSRRPTPPSAPMVTPSWPTPRKCRRQ